VSRLRWSAACALPPVAACCARAAYRQRLCLWPCEGPGHPVALVKRRGQSHRRSTPSAQRGALARQGAGPHLGACQGL